MPKGKKGFQKGHKVFGGVETRFQKGNKKSPDAYKFSKGHKTNIGRTMSDEQKEKLKIANKGGNSGSFKQGHKLTKEQSDKKRKSLKKKGSQLGFAVTNYNGKSHWCWKGGITPKNKTLRHSIMNKIWRESVFLRDNFTCQNKKCKFCNNKRGGELHAHHIKQFSTHPKLRFDVSNGITYCKDFHLKSGLHGRSRKLRIL